MVRICDMSSYRHPNPSGGPCLRQRLMRAGAAIVLGSALATLTLTGAGCANRAQTPRTTGPASVLDQYLGAYRDLDATAAVTAVGFDLRSKMPSTPEPLRAAMIASAQRFGRVQSWNVESSKIDQNNGQAFLGVRLTSEKLIYVMTFEIRRENGDWKIFAIRRDDTLANPLWTKELPSGYKSAHPFLIP